MRMFSRLAVAAAGASLLLARVALFTASLAHAKLSAGKHCLTATGITADLTAGAAAALNSALGTTLFAGGLDLGTAATSVRY